MTDQELIDLFSRRAEGAVSALQERYGGYCHAIAWRLLSDSRDVEECLSDCYLAVWNAIPPASPQHFKGWLGAIVRNRALAIGRENSRRPPAVEETALELAGCLPEAEGPEGRLSARELGAAVSAFLRRQKEGERTAFLRRYWYAQSVAEVAAGLGWSQAKTKSVLFRVRNRLRDHLVKEGYL